MRLITTIAGIGILMAGLGCATVDQNIKARKNLEKCKYALETLDLKKVTFGKHGPEDVIFDAIVKITNTTDDDVALDRVEADVYLDRTKTTNISHKKFIRIKSGNSASEKIDFIVPASSVTGLTGSRPENITIDAKVYVNVLIGKFTLETPIAIPVRKTFPIPYDRIEDAIRAKIEKVTDTKTDIRDMIRNKVK